jgi:hypothetical protein
VAVIPYRLYFLDGGGGIIRAENIEAPDDDAARKAAILLDHSFAIEIWQQARKVDIVKVAR